MRSNRNDDLGRRCCRENRCFESRWSTIRSERLRRDTYVENRSMVPHEETARRRSEPPSQAPCHQIIVNDSQIKITNCVWMRYIITMQQTSNLQVSNGQFSCWIRSLYHHLADILTHEITFYQGYLVWLFVFSKNNEYFVEALLTIGIHILCLYVCMYIEIILFSNYLKISVHWEIYFVLFFLFFFFIVVPSSTTRDIYLHTFHYIIKEGMLFLITRY